VFLGRAEFVVRNSNPLARLLPTRLRQDDTSISSDFLAAHHAGITWYLSRRLTEVSQTQKEMQEERVKRQLERSRTLGSSAAHAANLLGTSEPQAPKPSRAQEPTSSPGWFASGVAATIGAPLPGSAGSSKSALPGTPVTPSEFDDDEDDDIELSQSQIMQFEAENATMLRAVQDTLESVQQAESRLMDISALQMELVNRLTQQTELTDQLYEDAIATTSTVEKGNVQLREARRRSRDSRKWILMFLIGASLSLLFLHYY
jgi:syntaxin 18